MTKWHIGKRHEKIYLIDCRLSPKPDEMAKIPTAGFDDSRRSWVIRGGEEERLRFALINLLMYITCKLKLGALAFYTVNGLHRAPAEEDREPRVGSCGAGVDQKDEQALSQVLKINLMVRWANSSLPLWYLPLMSCSSAWKMYRNLILLHSYLQTLAEHAMNCCAISEHRFQNDFESKENLGRGDLCEHHHALTCTFR